MALFCPAQGSPVPAYRSVDTNSNSFRANWKFLAKVLLSNSPWAKLPCWAGIELDMSSPSFTHTSIQVGQVHTVRCSISAPIGTSAPKFSVESKTSSLLRESYKSLSLGCNAQSSPLPAFRLDCLFYPDRLFWLPAQCLLPTNIQDHYIVIIHHDLEPIGGSAPIFSLGLKSSTVEKPSSLPFSLSCPAQGFPVPSFRLDNCYDINWYSDTLMLAKGAHCRTGWKCKYILQIPEPIGGSPPKASSNVDPVVMVLHQSEQSLACPVQGSPKPSYRYYGIS